jgi:ubiquinone/menaquinone biosynthesis C-methylase UbiE
LNNGNAARRQFGLHAEKYRKSRTHGDPLILDHIIGLISPNKDAIALDVGCGGGHMTAALAAVVREIVAIDITPEMLVQTSLLTGERRLKNVELCLADADNLPFHSDVFDIVSCRIVLHHILDVGRAIAEMARVLEKNGSLFIQDILGFDDLESRDYMDGIEKLRDPSHLRNCNMVEWKGFLDACGLKVIHFEVVPRVYQLKEWTSRSGTSIDKIDEIKMKLGNMPREIENNLKASFSEEDWSIQMRNLLLLATKT